MTIEAGDLRAHFFSFLYVSTIPLFLAVIRIQ